MLCRVCLKESTCSLEIFNDNVKGMPIANILQRHFWFQLEPDDPISTIICTECWMKVNEFHQFYMMVKQAHFIFSRYPKKKDNATLTSSSDKVDEKNYNATQKSSSDNVDEKNYNATLKSSSDNVDDKKDNATLKSSSVNVDDGVVLHCEIDIKQEILDNNCYEGNVIEEKNMENENLLDGTELLKVKRESEIIDFRDTEDSAENTIPKYGENIVKRALIKQSRPKILIIGKKALAESSDDETDHEGEPMKYREGMITHQDEEVVKKHISMACDLCTFIAQDFNDMSQHFGIQHAGTSPYIMCYSCNKQLTTPSKVVQHAYTHENPAFFKGHECNKPSLTHPAEELLTFSCEPCKKHFPTELLLEQHKASHALMVELSFNSDGSQNERVIMKRRRWSKKETVLFLECYNERKDEFKHIRKKRFAYLNVLKDMSSRGFSDPSVNERTLEAKMRTLLVAYKNARDNSRMTGEPFKAPFMAEIEKIYGRNPEISDKHSQNFDEAALLEESSSRRDSSSSSNATTSNTESRTPVKREFDQEADCERILDIRKKMVKQFISSTLLYDM